MTSPPLTPDDLALLAAVDFLGPDRPDADGLRAMGERLRFVLRGSVADVARMDVADDVMLAIELHHATSAEVDVADDVMLAIHLHNATAAEVDVADDVMLALDLNNAVAAGVDVADDVMLAIDLHNATAAEIDVADNVMLAVSINEAVRPSPIDIADRVMASVGERAIAMPRWASLGVPAAAVAAVAMAAAVLLSVFVPDVQAPTETLTAEVALPVLSLASFNEAEVQDIQTAADTTVQVMQFEEGAPTIIFIQESGE